jgi:hypothetical protein
MTQIEGIAKASFSPRTTLSSASTPGMKRDNRLTVCRIDKATSTRNYWGHSENPGEEKHNAKAARLSTTDDRRINFKVLSQWIHRSRRSVQQSVRDPSHVG